MKLRIAVIAFVVLTGAAYALPWGIKETPIEGKWLGSNRCGTWPSGTRITSQNAADFNWVLGFLSGLAREKGENYLAGTSHQQLWTMVIAKCAAKPGSQLGTIAFEIERDLRK